MIATGIRAYSFSPAGVSILSAARVISKRFGRWRRYQQASCIDAGSA
jgi:hypothetical protein